jgi:hypothetical protein
VDVSQLDLARLAGLMPEGMKRGADPSAMTIGTVTGLDIPAGQVQVTVGTSEPVWLPAAPFIYEAGAKVRLRRSPLDGGKLEYCEGPLVAGPAIVTGTVLAVNTDTLTVRVLGQDVDLMFASSTYEAGDKVLVLRHTTGFGIPQGVIGLAGLDQPANEPGGGSGNPGQTQSRQATISPHDSGTFSYRFGRWDAWATYDRHGGAPSMWQGQDFGSGPLAGWAGYSDQVVNLHATAITKMWVDVIRADVSSSSPRALTVQGSPSGKRPVGAPDSSGDAASTEPLGNGEAQRIELPASTYEAWRTGAYRGLRTVGGDYMAAAGTNRGGAMALTIQYEVIA